MSTSYFILYTVVVVAAVCVLAYFVPGLILRAVNDFKERHKTPNTEGKLNARKK